MSKTFQSLKEKIQNKKNRLAIIGLGYVGLPLALEFASKGLSVIGIDTDESKIKTIRNGKSYITDVKDKEIKSAIKKKFKVTCNYAVLKTVDTIHICVPTPLRKTRDPDISYILQATQKIKQYLKKGQLIILESTTYPGTTEEVILPFLTSSNFKVGKDFFLAFSPERVDPGNKTFNLKNTPKVVGGVTDRCTCVATMVFKQIVDKVVPVSSTREAEMVKLLENTFRSVNIGLVNEIALMCNQMKINTWEVIEAAASKPYGYMPFFPGPGLGGHCIPIDPLYLSWKARLYNFEARFIDLAARVNGHMPLYIVERVTEILNQKGLSLKGTKILIIGISYKKDVGDIRESPALEILKLLIDKEALVSYHDPHVSKISMDGKTLKSRDLNKELLGKIDLAIIVTDHSSLNYPLIVKESKLVFDTRGITRKIMDKKGKIVRL